MNPFEEAGDLVAKIITFAVILIVPGTVFVYSIVSGVFLKEVGHEQTSNVVTTAGNVYGETTTVLGREFYNFLLQTHYYLSFYVF